MTVYVDSETEILKWIEYAQSIADGSATISPCTLERVAQIQGFDSPFRLELAEGHLRNTFNVLVAALNSPSRKSIIEFFGTAYKHDHKTP